MNKILLGLIVSSILTYVKPPTSEVTGYYFGKNDIAAIDLQLSNDSTFCKYFHNFEFPCHGSGRSFGKWNIEYDTLFLEYRGTKTWWEKEAIFIPRDTFLIRKKKLLQIGPRNRIESQNLKLKRFNHTMNCEEKLY